MKVDKHSIHVEFDGEDGDHLSVSYDNRGDPYREGVTLGLETEGRHRTSVFLDNREAVELRDLLLKLYPVKT